MTAGQAGGAIPMWAQTNGDPTVEDVSIASKNWQVWKRVFEHAGDPSDNPLLAEPCTFKNFISEYRVQRTVRKHKHDELRERLRSSPGDLQKLVEDTSGQELDRQERILRTEFGTREGARSILSAMSKIAAFLAPDSFSAMDQYARRGVRKAIPGRPSPTNYAEYLASVNEVFGDKLGAIKSVCEGRYPTENATRSDGFHRRVLDVYLMRLGGRREFVQPTYQPC
jgi:hypothetical protein